MSLNPEVVMLVPDEWLLAYLKAAFMGWIVALGCLQGSCLLSHSPLGSSGPANASSP